MAQQTCCFLVQGPIPFLIQPSTKKARTPSLICVTIASQSSAALPILASASPRLYILNCFFDAEDAVGWM